MKYSEYVRRMKEIPYTESLGYRLGYGALTSRGKEWPQIVDILDDTVGTVKIPLYHCRNKRYVRVLGFTPEAFRGKDFITDIIISKVNNLCIDAGSFAGCRNLKRITLPRIMRIEKDAFKNCDRLEDIYFAGSLEEWRQISIVSEKHVMDFGNFISGTPVQKLESERLVHIPGNDALFKATIHFNCDLDELIPDGPYILIHRLMKESFRRMSVTMEEIENAEKGDFNAVL